MISIKEKTRFLVRVSRDDQAKKDSPKTQKYFLHKSIDPEKETYDKTYLESGNSAQIKDSEISYDLCPVNKQIIVKIPLDKRPDFLNMLIDARNKEFNRLKFLKWNRFTRNVLHYIASKGFLERNGIKLEAIHDSNEPAFLISIIAVLSQKELDDRSESTKDNQRMRFEKGFFKGNAIYGYNPIKDAEDGLIKAIEVDIDRAKDIIKVYLSRLKGQSVTDACSEITKIREIKKDGIKTGEERVPISESSYRTHLKDKRYAGFIEFEGEEKKSAFTPIIPLDVFETVQKIKGESHMTSDELRSFKIERKYAIRRLKKYSENTLNFHIDLF